MKHVVKQVIIPFIWDEPQMTTGGRTQTLPFGGDVFPKTSLETLPLEKPTKGVWSKDIDSLSRCLLSQAKPRTQTLERESASCCSMAVIRQ